MADNRPTLDLNLVWKAGHQPQKTVEPELFALLDAIKNTGKLTAATQRVGMPYRQAWGLITAWSERIGQPLVDKEQGRGTRLTPLGERLLWVRERISARLTPHLESAASEVEQQLNELLREPNLALTMFASHDLVLAELREFLRTRPGPKLDVRFVGSLESVIALCKGRCELAGFHVPDGPLGREILKKYEPWLKPRAQRVIHFVRRHQGLLVAAGNPLGITTLKDVAAKGARFINRQRGSGTRLALERMLQEQGIDRAEINGFYAEEFTHLAVAAAIASGVADVGIGIEAAARRLKLDFIPLFVEDYYLLGKRETIERADIEAIIAILTSPGFRALVNGIPGYDVSRTGEVSNVSDVIG
ncbi:MAG: helix-turn-helix transcriptional regulator [Rhizobiales bacterium]|jgi:molybdate transport repressor ModE-like protein|nr:helix-turn-helix transcriptional regulator [Hyphomicrobiales bacterium]